jgi:hypothetical protein
MKQAVQNIVVRVYLLTGLLRPVRIPLEISSS